MSEPSSHSIIKASGLFDADFYARQLPEPPDERLDLIGHYLDHGSARGLRPNRFFSPEWYRMQHPDVAAARLEPLVHYIANGSAEGRKPGPLFDPTYYRRHHPAARSMAPGAEPLAHHLARGGLLEQGLDEYADWIARYDSLTDDDRIEIQRCVERLPRRPLISVIVPVYNTPAAYLRAAIDSVLNQHYGHWELCIADDHSPQPHVRSILEEYAARDPRIKLAFRQKNGHISATSNDALALATGEFVALLDHDDLIRPHALFMVASAIAQDDTIDIVYSDEDRIDAHGDRFLPYFKPDFDRTLLLAQNFVCHLAVYRRSLIDKIGGFRSSFDGAQDYDLILRAQAATEPQRIHHVPHVLYHWRAIAGSTAANSDDAKPYARASAIDAVASHLADRGLQATVQQSPHPAFNRITLTGSDDAVLVIANGRPEAAALRRQIDVLLAKAGRVAHHVVVTCLDGAWQADAALSAFLAEQRQRITVMTPESLSQRLPDWARRGEYAWYCIVDCDVDACEPDWLSELVSQGRLTGAGVVGGTVRNAAREILAGGYVWDGSRLPRCYFGGLAADWTPGFGYFGRAVLAQQVSAVSSACMLLSGALVKEMFQLPQPWLLGSEVGLSASRLAVATGRPVVWTPHANLISNGFLAPTVRQMLAPPFEHRDLIDRDPTINPNLVVKAKDLGLAFPPRTGFFWRHGPVTEGRWRATSAALDTAATGFDDMTPPPVWRPAQVSDAATATPHPRAEAQALVAAWLENLATGKADASVTASFESAWYLANNPDVAAAGVDPLLHYLQHGWKEGRKPCRCFDPAWYLQAYRDIAEAGVEPLGHFLEFGRHENRLPIAPCDEPAPEEPVPAPPLAPPEPAALATPSAEIQLAAVRESGLFVESFYLSENPDVLVAGIDPLNHYFFNGCWEGRRPNSVFDPVWYATQHDGIKQAGWEPLAHYLLRGRDLGHHPSATFNPSAYRAEHPDLQDHTLDPLTHHLQREASLQAAAHARDPSQHLRFSDFPPLIVPDLFSLRTMRQRGELAVVLHLYHPEMWPEMEAFISNIGAPFDLFVTLVRGFSDHCETDIKRDFPFAQVFVFEQDRGRDVARFMALLESGVFFKYKLLCKIHSKRSTYVADGDAWRRELIAGVLGSRDLVSRILAAFDADPDLGIVVADGNLYGGEGSWSGHDRFFDAILPRLGIYQDYRTLQFPGGGMFWIRPIILRALLGAQIDISDFEPEPMPINGALGHAVERLYGLLCIDAGMKCLETSAVMKQEALPPARGDKPSLIAFVLPQFHPVPENSQWWGDGFTEWANVTKAQKLFADHKQPRLPTELGFYDLRLADTRQAQAALAAQHGINAFCYYYYWFNGRRILERPLNEVLETGQPDFPFLICWANEPWSRNWDGLTNEVLLPQTYDTGWEQAFARDVAPILRDPRYFRYDGKPMLLVYRIRHIPELVDAMASLRATLAAEGVPEVHLVAGLVDFPGDEDLPDDPASVGFDAFYEFPPHRAPAHLLKPRPRHMYKDCRLIYSYGRTVDAAIAKLAEPVTGVRHRGVMAGFDNTARRGAAATVFHGASPANFRRWLRAVVQDEQSKPGSRVVFLNAWNEWAEGTYLEPDRDFGRGWLEAVASACGLKTDAG